VDVINNEAGQSGRSYEWPYIQIFTERKSQA